MEEQQEQVVLQIPEDSHQVGGGKMNASVEKNIQSQYRSGSITAEERVRQVRQLQAEAIRKIENAVGSYGRVMTNNGYGEVNDNTFYNGRNVLDHRIWMNDGRRIEMHAGYNVAGELVTSTFAYGGGRPNSQTNYELQTSSEVANWVLDEIKKSKK